MHAARGSLTSSPVASVGALIFPSPLDLREAIVSVVTKIGDVDPGHCFLRLSANNRDDPTRFAFDRFLVSSSCNAVIAGKGDQLLYVTVGVVLLLDHAR